MGNIFNRQMSDVSIAMLESSLKKTKSQVDDLASKLIDVIYPVGSYYDTSDDTFDPNVSWGGTWELESEGLVHIGAGNTYEIGDTGGSKTHTLTVGEMPPHYHTYDKSFKSGTVISTGSEGTAVVDEYGGSSQANTGSKGGGQPHSIMQPYIVVNRWHRIE